MIYEMTKAQKTLLMELSYGSVKPKGQQWRTIGVLVRLGYAKQYKHKCECGKNMITKYAITRAGNVNLNAINWKEKNE